MVGIFRNGKGAVGHILGDREEGKLSLVNGSISKREKDSLEIVCAAARGWPGNSFQYPNMNDASMRVRFAQM